MKNIFTHNLYADAISNIRATLDRKEKRRGGVMLLLLFASALIDVVGLAGILPVIAVAVDFSIVENNTYLNSFYNFIGIEDKFRFLLFLSALLFFVLALKNVFALAVQYIQARYAFSVSIALSKKQFQYNYEQGYFFIKNEDTADMIYKITGIPIHFAKFYIIPFFNLTTELVVLFLIIICIWIFQPTLLLILGAATIPGFVAIYVMTKNKVKEFGDRRDVLYPLSVQRVVEAMNGFVDVKLSNNEQQVMDEYESIQYEINRMDALSTGIYTRIHQRSNEAIAALGIIGIFTFGVLFPDTQPKIILLIGAFGVAAFRIIPSFNRIVTAMLSMKSFSFTTVRLAPLRNRAIVEFPKHSSMPFATKLEIKNLGLRYPDSSAAALNQVNIEVAKGEMIGITGESGSGKTTLLNVILRFLKEQEGEILVDGVALTDKNEGQFQRILGYVEQDVFIKDAPLRENIAFNRADMDENAVLDAIKQTQLEDFVAGLPQGLDTMLGEDGARLSGGQRQRIGIARALYKNADILLFDEITSALDGDTEDAIIQSIHNLAELRKTVIIVAHRLTTLKYCDRIYIMKNGQVERIVSYADLSKGMSSNS